MATVARDAIDLETALLRRGVVELAAERERCARCRRTPLIGERIYEFGRERSLCELCRGAEGGPPQASRLVHGPEFGHTLRIGEQRAA